MTGVGLCGACRNARRIVSARGSVFLLCRLSRTDERFARYPQLPVWRCPGFREVNSRDGHGEDETDDSEEAR